MKNWDNVVLVPEFDEQGVACYRLEGAILLALHMMPSLNMCGFLYEGPDIGGFGSNTTEDLVLRWYGEIGRAHV